MPNRDQWRGGRVGSVTLRTARNAAALTAAELTGKLFTLAYTVVAARLLSPDQFGRFAYALAISQLVVVLPKWGFNADVIRRGSRDRDRLDVVLSASLVWTLGVGVVAFAAVGVVSGASRDTREGVVVLALMLVATLLDAVSDRMRAGAAAIERQHETSLALVANRVVTSAVIVAALLAGGGVVGMGAGYLAGSALDVWLTTLVVRRRGIRPRLRAPRADIIGAVRGAWVLGLGSVAAMVLFRIDQVIIDALLGAAALATYAVAYRLVETVLFLSWSLSRAVLPVLASAEEQWRLRRGLSRGVAVLALVYVPFAVVAVVEPTSSLALVFGEQYAEPGTPVLRWLAPSPLLFGVSYLAAQVLVARGREGWALVANSIATVLNVGLNLLLIPIHGIAAAAAVTTGTLAVRALVTVGACRLPGGALSVVAAHLNAVVAGTALAAVLYGLDMPILLELTIGGVVYAALWVAVTRLRTPEQLAVLRAVLTRDRTASPVGSRTPDPGDDEGDR